MSRLLLVIGIFLLLLTEILRVYFIMPFPGSQHSNSIDLAYFIEKNKWILRIIGILFILRPVYHIFSQNKSLCKILTGAVLTLYAVIFILFNFRFQADKMFYQPEIRNFASAIGNKTDSNKLIIGIEISGQARAYPIQIIGYHHQVKDTVGNTPVMITYCTVCRTGRVYSPYVNGKPEMFRLVGMDHFNAMFEDATTKSWWQQATGVAIAGPLKGMKLSEIPSRQSSMAAWFRSYPHSTVLQPDSNYKKNYEDLADFDKGTIKGSLEKRDSASWKKKSWVVGIKIKGFEKAYDWNDLLTHHFIQDTAALQPILVLLENDTSTFHVYSRFAGNRILYFIPDIPQAQLTDTNTHSVWNLDGLCLSGSLKNVQLQTLPASQEFWHSWKQFHPNTSTYKSSSHGLHSVE